MILASDKDRRRDLNEKLITSTSLTVEQQERLHSELQKPEYAGLSATEIVTKLNSPSRVPNPSPEYIPRTEWVCAELINRLKQIGIKNGESAWKRLNDLAASNPQAWEAQDTLRTLPLILFSNPSVQALFPVLKVALGLSDDEYRDLVSVKDASREEFIEGEPPAYCVCDGATIELGDL